ncbi:hypothetical protein BC941DRAFT_472337 [Chlamydoabsidia padenii]|nr:hypothetical protein BC941DRAFT_472337 [Chlamydoabsidia padenii]
MDASTTLLNKNDTAKLGIDRGDGQWSKTPAILFTDNVSSTTDNKVAPLLLDKDTSTTTATLVRALLEVSTPHLEAKIVDMLLVEDTMQLFMAYITRLKGNNPPTQDLSSRVKEAQHERDRDDLDAMKRSYHAMEILTGTSTYHFKIQDTRFESIITSLFDIFSPASHGNFNHFAKIFQHLVRRHPADMLDFLFLQPNSLFFDCMLPHIHSSAVVDSILAILFVNDINMETKDKRQTAHQKLSDLGLLPWLVKAIGHHNSAFSVAAGELVVRIIEEASQVDNGHVLLQVLEHGGGGRIIMESLVKMVENQTPSPDRNRMIKILLLLTKSGLLTTRTSPVAHLIHGPLYSISVQCQEMLSDHIPHLCSVISNDRHSVSSKQLPLTLYDMDLLDIIYSTLPHIKNKTGLIDAIPTAFWRIVVNSFFEKRQVLDRDQNTEGHHLTTSSIYHALFYRIFCLVLDLRYEPLIIILIRQQKLVTRMIDLYEDTKQQIDTRGYILLVLNYLRLMTDAEPTGVLHRIMTNHPRYCEFLPKLRKDTLAQIRFNYTWKLDSCPRPPTHIGPSPPIRSPPYSSFTPTLQLTEDVGENKDLRGGIDLGSDCKYIL